MIALYARVSTDGQVETGLVSQLAELRRFVNDKFPGEPSIEFVDDGYTGANFERPQLNELRAQIRAGRIRIVVASDPDRLGRNLIGLLLLVKEFDKAGVILDFVRGGFEPTDMGRMVLQFRGVIAEYERTQIRARTQRGRLEAARQGRSGGGRWTFGYDQAEGLLTVNESQAATVRRIFDMVLDGVSVRGIATKLNDAGIPPQRGSRWQTSSVHRILGNETYIGRAIYNRRKRGSDGRITLRPESDWIQVPAPAIVSPDTFARAQERLKRNSSLLSGQPDRAYLLRGLLRCGLCGYSICGCASHGRRYYRCHARDRLLGERRCYAPLLDAERIEATVIGSIQRLLRSGLLQKKIAEHGPKIRRVDYDVEIAKTQREIDTLSATEERAARFLVAPEHAGRQALFERQLNQATEKRVSAETRKAALEKARIEESALADRSDAVREMSRRALRALSRLTPERWRQALPVLLDEVRVTGRKLELRGILPADARVFSTEPQHVVGPRCGHLQRALGSDLPAHFFEIEFRQLRLRSHLPAARPGHRLKSILLLKEGDYFSQMLQGENAHASRDRGLGAIIGRHHQIPKTLALRRDGDRERAPHRPQRAIE